MASKENLLFEIRKTLKKEGMSIIGFPFERQKRGFTLGLMILTDGKDIWYEQNGKYLEPKQFPALYEKLLLPCLHNQYVRFLRSGQKTKYKGNVKQAATKQDK